MAKNFINKLNPKEKQLTLDRIEVLIDLLDPWVKEYPTIRPARIPTAALMTAITLPKMSVINALPMAKIILWVFSIDDLADERIISLEEFNDSIESWYQIACGNLLQEANCNNCELSLMLLEIRQELSQLPLFEIWCDDWASALRCNMEGMAQEYQHALWYDTKQSYTLPTLDNYLAFSKYSIFVVAWVETLFITLNDVSISKQVTLIRMAIDQASRAIRLYNDIRSYEKEIEENNINSVLIMYKQLCTQYPNKAQDKMLAEAKRHVFQLAKKHKESAEYWVNQIQTDTGQIEDAFFNFLSFHSYFYGDDQTDTDYHTTNLDDINQWLID